jgi:cytochrome c biogenesis protein CcmG/thiol:disulfide interchange protein DsbE
MKVARVGAIATAVVLVALVLVLIVSDGDTDVGARSPLLGQPAPAVVTTTIEDESFDLTRRKGSWVVLNFFNSTCVPCIAEHPSLVSFARAESSRIDGAEFYTVVNDDSDEAIRDFFAANDGDWPKLRDTDGAIAVGFGVAKVPETWIIDPNGFVRLRIMGAVTDGVLEAQMTRLRAEEAP